MKPNLISNTLIYGLSGTLVALIPFVLLPFMTRALSQGDFGTALFFSALTTIALPFIGLGASNAISVRFFQLDTNKLSNYIWSCIFLNFVSTFFLIFIFYFSHTLFSDLLIIDSSWIYLSICISGFWGISQSCGIYLIARSSPKLYFVINALIGIPTVGLTIFLINFFGYSWQGFALALFVSHFLAAIVSLAILKIEVGFSKVCKEYVIDSLKFGSPIMIHSLGLALITYFDRLIVSNFLGIEKLGEYSVAFQLGIILSFIAQAFNKAFVPWLYGNLKINSMESHLKIVRGTYLIFLLIIVFVLIFISLLDFLIIIFAGESYRNVFNIAAIISIGSAFNAAYLTVINYVFYAEKTLELSLLTMSVAIFFIILSFILTPLLGLIGASISFAISNLLLFLSVWMLAIRSYKMPWFSMKLFIQ